MSLEILYEDNHLIVCIKPIGVLSQADNSNDMDMLTLLKHYIKDKYQKPGNVYLGLVHRLDRMTGGVMVFAKTSKAASRLNEQIRLRTFNKRYYCIVHGVLNGCGTLENYLYKDEQEVKSYVVNSKVGKHAILNYNAIKTIDNKTLVEVELLTGRHHQIRVQMAHINHALVGDKLYGGSDKYDMMLYAYSLSFEHPITKERLTFTKIPHFNLWNDYL